MESGQTSAQSQQVSPNLTPPASVEEKKSNEKCNQISFHSFCKQMEKISNTKGIQSKLDLLFPKAFYEYLQNDSIYPFLRLLVPSLDSERGQYDIKEKFLARIYSQALHIPKESQDALEASMIGDFSSCLEKELVLRLGLDPTSHSIGEVNQLLDELSNKIKEEKETFFINNIIFNFNPLEQKWLIRLIFRNLKIGLGNETILRALNIWDSYHQYPNLKQACRQFFSNLEYKRIQLFIPFTPMKSGRMYQKSLEYISEHTMKRKDFIIEPILKGGERVVIHVGESNDFVIFTANQVEVSDTLWPLAHDIIDNIRKKTSGVDLSCILEGLIVAYDLETSSTLPSDKIVQIASKEREYGAGKEDSIGWFSHLQRYLTFYPLDIVYLAGSGSQELITNSIDGPFTQIKSHFAGDLTHLPLSLRLQLLKSILEAIPTRINFISQLFINKSNIYDDTNQQFHEWVDDTKPGVILKLLNSAYYYNETRPHGSWMRIIPRSHDDEHQVESPTAATQEPAKKRKIATVDEQFRLCYHNEESHTLPEPMQIFKDLSFCVYENMYECTVINKLFQFSRDQLVEELRKYGGNILAHPMHKECLIIAGKEITFHLQNLIKGQKYNVVLFEYIANCLFFKKLLPLKPCYFLSMTNATASQFRDNYDDYGDSYTQNVNERELKLIFNQIPDKTPSQKEWRNCIQGFSEEEINTLILPENPLYAPGMIIYLDFYKTFGSDHIGADTDLFHYDDFDQERIDKQRFPTALQQIKWKQFHYQLISHGCLIHNQLHNQVTHVILVDEEELKMVERYGFILERLLAMGKSAKDVQIVSIKWLEESLKLNTLIPILEEFQINKLLY